MRNQYVLAIIFSFGCGCGASPGWSSGDASAPSAVDDSAAQAQLAADLANAQAVEQQVNIQQQNDQTQQMVNQAAAQDQQNTINYARNMENP